MPGNLIAAQASAVPVPTSETAVLTLPAQAINLPPSGPGLLVEFWIAFTGGVSTTGVTLRIRAGSGTGGTLLQGPLTFPIGGAITGDEAIMVIDPTVAGPAVQYTLTAAAVGAAGTATDVVGTVEPVQATL